jgi:hypothetical protein
MQPRAIVRIGAAACMLLALACNGAAAAESRTPEKAAYLRYCSACHGEGGKGDGVVSGFMRPKPTDLTQAAKANHGEFPYGRMIRVVDGRETIRAHGDPDMPVWADVFRAEDGMTSATGTRIRGKVLMIVEHLSTIQEK